MNKRGLIIVWIILIIFVILIATAIIFFLGILNKVDLYNGGKGLGLRGDLPQMVDIALRD